MGTGKTLIPAGSVTDGNAGNNYAITFVNNTTGVINQLAITVTAAAKSQVYGEAAKALTYTITSGALQGSDSLSGSLVRAPGANVGTYAITQGSLTIQIGTSFNVSQPNPLSPGQTVVTPEQSVSASENRKNLVSIKDGANVEDLVNALNGLGVSPKEMVAIFQALKAAGALQAELELI